MKTTRNKKRTSLTLIRLFFILGFIFFLWNVIFMTMKISIIEDASTTTSTSTTTTTASTPKSMSTTTTTTTTDATTIPDNKNHHDEKQVIKPLLLLLKEEDDVKHVSFKEQQQQLGSDTATRYAANITTTTTNNNNENTTNNATTTATSRRRRRSMIPSSFQSFEKGGLILFLHIPKTGGSTIRFNIEQKLNSTINYYFVSGKGSYEEYIPIVTKYVSYGLQRKRYWRKPIMIEIHGRDSPSLLQLHKKLLTLRRLAKLNGIPTYFFTIIRKPIEYQISYFNFFHVHYDKYNKNRSTKYFPQVNIASEENLLQYSLYNPQCQFLSRGEFSLRNLTEKQIPTKQECNQVYNVLCETMDWVGTTERLDIEILPLLKRILLFNFNLSSSSNFQFDKHLVVASPSESEFDNDNDNNNNNNNNNNKNGNNNSRKNKNVIKNIKESISYRQLNKTTISIIKSMNQLDFELYDKLQEEFPFTTTPTTTFTTTSVQ